jgi:hypothetical protein
MLEAGIVKVVLPEMVFVSVSAPELNLKVLPDAPAAEAIVNSMSPLLDNMKVPVPEHVNSPPEKDPEPE